MQRRTVRRRRCDPAGVADAHERVFYERRWPVFGSQRSRRRRERRGERSTGTSRTRWTVQRDDGSCDAAAEVAFVGFDARVREDPSRGVRGAMVAAARHPMDGPYARV